MDLLDAHGRAMDVFDRAVHKVGDRDWRSPTPCADWDVRALTNHIVSEQLWVPELLAGRTVEAIGDAYDGDVLGHDPVATWTTASQAARAAWLAPGTLDRDVHLSFGDTDGREYCWQMTIDLAVHGWDLATALDMDAGMGDELAGMLLGYIEPRAAAWQGSGLFAEPVDPGSPADPQRELIAMLGRRPR
ncbi:TIGR03086 family metal-binding protein [Actinophytocola sediminis]